MPPKPKASTEPKAPSLPPPANVEERSRQRYDTTNPVQRRFDEAGFPSLTPAEKKTYAHARLILPVARHSIALSNKSEREFWKHVAKEGLPIRRLTRDFDWGRDRHGRDVATYGLDEFRDRSLAQARLTALDLLHRRFIAQREAGAVSHEDVAAEHQRRRDMAELTRQLYGGYPGILAMNPEWDDVAPIPQIEPADALAKIAYPDVYADAVSYLRAVMAAEEHSPRALRLTETIISMNPAHYTVWLFRFKIITALALSIPDEIAWLNGVAMANLKNYQIWHHRQLLLDHYFPTISDAADAVAKLARSEIDFTVKILAEDTKNYHVWSYRQHLVARLGLWGLPELAATQNMIEEDLRNNSAWSHRFFLVFSDPAVSTPGCGPLQHDARLPDGLIEREAAYARDKILLAPQNQSAWHYLRGVLLKGGRGLDSIADFAEQFVEKLGGGEGERVRSSHALDLLSEVYAGRGDVERARLCLQRLAEKWDPVREGYWRYRMRGLESQ